ncbi:MAG: hypothetical protein LBJ46_08075 [Planctomycetota bacterium]|jgi:cell fate regulator YaaT (PSP1 superfamily)|nr:hypothetical protein [Planctomycetota bacterium]
MSFIIPVRYGLMAVAEGFLSESDAFRVGDEVVVKTGRGIDLGEVAAKPRPLAENEEPAGELLRIVNEADQRIASHIRESREPEEFHTCQQCIRERQLPMRLVGVEHLFSGDKIIFYFLAENRVDFRELVKELARRYRTRIEMRQIGVRDEARLLADYEHCGRELCCRTFIRNLEPVTMRMAKTQKTTLDPSKISGHCGRLMCCLRFEDEVYAQLQSEMPQRGAMCVTENFSGEVVAFDMFKREIVLALPDGGEETVHISQIKEIHGRKGRPLSGAYPAREATQARTSGRFPGRHSARNPGRPSARRDGQAREEGQEGEDGQGRQPEAMNGENGPAPDRADGSKDVGTGDEATV